ncbi:DUF484 family protein [Amylibacter sp. IMCC11727]|uniref:DUF484 family protein n=1 Tax=Amylibacter sp. IMCC11727 TaxID=3039851 RepID=UPI00244DBE52|nr:DUF484 family protein [Amylibacter sp. IMCC11727]WGI22543.1 DUF484 family protein [Amylibacter sp. IMCC11727]
MSEQAKPQDAVRKQILKNPNRVLEDHDIMRALISADEQARGKNVVDLRTIALERLESRLDRLEDTHRHVIAAAYDNLASTNQIHRATLAILEPDTFAEFLELLKGELARILNVASARLVLESPAATPEMEEQLQEEFGSGVCFCAPGAIAEYITRGRDATVRPVTLRAIQDADPILFGDAANTVTSEALLRIDLGQGNLPAMLVLGSVSTDQFTPQKGADLLVFFASAFERVLRRWLN